MGTLPRQAWTADLPLYSEFLDFVSDRAIYEVHTVAEYDTAYDPDRINVLLRHDVDYSNGLDMAEMDFRMGFRSTNYLRVYSDQIPALHRSTLSETSPPRGSGW